MGTSPTQAWPPSPGWLMGETNEDLSTQACSFLFSATPFPNSQRTWSCRWEATFTNICVEIFFEMTF